MVSLASRVMTGIRLAFALWLGLFLSAGTLSATAVAPPPSLPPFSIPERLNFSISWIGIPVGESTLSVKPMEPSDLGPLYHFVSTARSNHVLRLLYPVKTRIDSYVAPDAFLPVRYTMTGRQGYRTRDRELRFDQTSHHVALVMEGTERVYPTAEAVQDPLSALYYYRTMAGLTPGDVVRIPVHDRKRPKEIVVTTEAVEVLDTKIGRLETVRLKVKQTEEGLFLHQGDITVWITADARRLPVRMEGQVTIGTVTAEVTAYRAGSPFAGDDE